MNRQNVPYLKKGYMTSNIMSGAFTFNSGWGASNLTKDLESCDESKTIKSQHIFHILGVKGRHTLKVYNSAYLHFALTHRIRLVGEHILE